MKTPKEVASHLHKEQMDYIEDCLSGLLAAGVPKEDIEVQNHPDLVMKIAVKGVVKYTHQINTSLKHPQKT
jgi:hypothetical protein